MAGRRSETDDIIDARVRFSEDILRDPSIRQDGREDRSSSRSPQLPQSQTPAQNVLPRLTPTSPTRRRSPSPGFGTNLYTIQSNTEGPTQADTDRLDRTSRQSWVGSPRGRPWGRNAAGATAASPARADEPSASTARTRTSEANDERKRLSRRSGVSFVDPPPPQSTTVRPDVAYYDTPFKASAMSAATRVTETSETLAHYRDWVRRQRERQRRWTRGPYGRFRTKTSQLYQKYIIEGLLRQRPLPPTVDGRHVPLDPGQARLHPFTDERTNKPYVSNFIRSSRYTVWDFVPRQLIFQFMKLANFYFLVISVLQMIPGLSTTGTYTTIAPLLFFVAVSMGKEGYDDYRRYRLDRVENRSTVWVLDPGHTVRSRPHHNHSPQSRGMSSWKQGKWHLPKLSRSSPGQHAGLDVEEGTMDMTELQNVRSPSHESGTEGAQLAAVETEGSLVRDRMPWSAVQWQDLRVGDIVRLRRDDSVPADIVLLHATGPNGIAYIETMALDGETNLKTKQALPELSEQCDSLAGMAACGAEFVSEDPNLDLYNYEGRVVIGGSTLPLTLNQVVFRGSVVRNTAETIGLVINSGEECKIRMNTHRHKRAKAPAMQFKVNRIVILLVFFVVLLSVGCTIGNGIWVPRYERPSWYLDGSDLPLHQIIFAFVIMFNTLIPLSLYVSLEIIKVGQMLLMNDIEMYDDETDTPMVVNTTTILENLGQVSYIFSDKTGTLTENKMRFRKMSVAGTAWLHDMDIARDAEEKEKKRKSVMLQRKGTGMSRAGKSRAHRFQPNSSKPPQQPRPSSETIPAEESLLADQQGEPSLRLSQSSPAVPRRSMSTSQWRSTVRPNRAQPELKTEDLIQYIRHRPHTAFSRKARQFILCIALCHTCLPETRDDGEIDFQAASPDELALVQAARDLGYLLVDRPAQSIKLQFQQLDGSLTMETYQVLDVVEFSSKRKRMSIVIRMPDGRICMFCKGADSVILPRLKLNQMALQKASAVERRASKRKSIEQERAMRRISIAASIGGGPSGGGGGGGGSGTPRSSINIVRSGSINLRGLTRMGTAKKSADFAAYRRSGVFSGDMDEWLTLRERESLDDGHPHRDNSVVSTSAMGRRSRDGVTAVAAAAAAAAESLYDDPYGGLVDEALAVNEGAVFDRCFQHIDDFASEGLRTLLFAYRYLEEDDYRKWKSIYQDATTSLVDRQQRIEAAADLVEQGFELAGATAIEDKLQQGVPETIDKMRRANIKIWMLTGDKRETAINIANAARISKSFSDIYVLDAAADGDGLQERIASTLVDVARGMTPHSVVVIDGHTLSVVEEQEEMRILFFDLVARVDSVICCRASPSQKATLVKCIRERVPSSMTLAIGDGANDIAMIQASHVGVGISGREGLQAARISDYSIAQFRFLQRLLLVHGRWNYIRTGKYIIGTFWKELLFYLVQALYQQYNGYTGTSFYESTSLTVFNTLFTSLPVILYGIFEKDLRADTLLAVPELYTFGQRNLGFCFRKYVGWMALAVSEAFVVFYVIYGSYINALFTVDNGVLAMGSLAFTICVVFINIKMLIIEMHNQTIISAVGFVLSVGGWFLWNIVLSGLFAAKNGPYPVRRSFLDNYGRQLSWWLTVLAGLVVIVAIELIVIGVRRVFWPTDQDVMQEIEHYDAVRAVLKEHAAENGEAAGAATDLQPLDDEVPRKSSIAGGRPASINSNSANANTAAAMPAKGKETAKSHSLPQPAATLSPPISPQHPPYPAPVDTTRRWISDDLASPTQAAAFTTSPVQVRFPPPQLSDSRAAAP